MTSLPVMNLAEVPGVERSRFAPGMIFKLPSAESWYHGQRGIAYAYHQGRNQRGIDPAGLACQLGAGQVSCGLIEAFKQQKMHWPSGTRRRAASR